MLRRYDRKYIYDNLEELIEKNRNRPGIEIFTEYFKALDTCFSWERVIDFSIDGIFLADKDGIALYANQAYEEISGLKREEIEGVDLREFISRDYVTNAITLRCIETKRPITDESFFYRTGKKAMVTCNPVFRNDAPDEVEFVVSNVRDMTEVEVLKEKYRKEKEKNDRFRRSMETLREQMSLGDNYIAKDPATLRTFGIARRVGMSDSTVLLTGETGVGKEVIAQYIHENSMRAGENFVKVNCSAIAANLFESELFGYEKGAFTGANKEGKKGLFEVADGGSIFLDEIGELPLDMQAKLLRVLQEQELTRVGGTQPVRVNVRVISATNRDLKKMIQEGRFREDLYYRLCVLPIMIPPLCERKGDIPDLARFFVERLNRKYGEDKHLAYESVRDLTEYSWPGNIRELRNMIERSYILSTDNEIRIPELDPEMQGQGAGTGQGVDFLDSSFIDLNDYIGQIEYRYMKRAYKKYGNVREAADHLGMKKSTFAGKMKSYEKLYGKE